MEKLLEVRALKTYFHTPKGIVSALENVDFHVNKGETLCIVGESGCGKSVTSLSIMQLLSVPPAQYVQGEILFEAQDLLKKSEKQMQKIRGNEIAMIFQEPMTALNPVYTIGRQIRETILLHKKISKKEADREAEELLNLVGIPDAKRRLKEYPHQLSGGLRQRVVIAIALSCKPKLLIADEPTTALDVTIQAQILRLLNDLKKKLDMTIILITHDLGVVAQMADRVIVMYGGAIVEEAPKVEFFDNPIHPYTKGLLGCIVRMDCERGKLVTIDGIVPSLLNRKEGCIFYNRCIYAKDECKVKTPELITDGSRRVACLEMKKWLK